MTASCASPPTSSVELPPFRWNPIARTSAPARLATAVTANDSRDKATASVPATPTGASSSGNADSRRPIPLMLTGNKADQSVFYYHTGFPGGIKGRTLRDRLSSKFPERVVQKAVERMITRGPLQRAQMKHLYVYAGTAHPHDGQQPRTLDVAALNPKNKRV